jgi:anhydro-N-acetylmuramic acid kinase
MQPNTSQLSILGLMSGSSMDGLDLAYCTFLPTESGLDWSIQQSATIPFSEAWVRRLSGLPEQGAYDLAKAHTEFGVYLGELVAAFLAQHNLSPDLLASHGHTIFHYPDQGFTCQLGDGAAIAATSGFPVADNFRVQDIVSGGQGAPIAPIADELLFPDYDFLINLGGIANMSGKTPVGYVAFDVTGANQLLNHLVKPLGLAYDQDGRLAAQGQLRNDLLQDIHRLSFFDKPYPKSLGNDWVRDQLIPIFDTSEADIPSKLYTACKHIAFQLVSGIEACLDKEQMRQARQIRILATGGGAFNLFLVDLIQKELERLPGATLEIPGQSIIAFKEALLMALMGYLRLQGLPNCQPKATGASRPSVGGALHFGWKANRL